jgi:hypothetical protein
MSRQAFTVGQTDVPGEPQYFCRMAVTSVAGASNFARLTHKIEGVRSFAGQQITVSFWAKADASKNIAIEFGQWFGDGGSPSSFVGAIGTTKKALATSWQKITHTVTVPAIVSKTIGSALSDFLELNIWFDAGSTFNSNTDTLGQQSGTFDIAQVQVEPGPIATTFERRPIGTELGLCQRYFCSTIFNNRFFAAGAPTFSESYIYWPVQMRVAPTVTLNTTGILNATALASDPSVTGARAELVSLAAGDAHLLNAPVTASAEL